MSVYLSELFSSIQGEGPLLGERHLFIRFCDCHRNCQFCDTDFSRKSTFSLETEAGSGQMIQHSNPLSVDDLLNLVARFDKTVFHPHLALTGGEPLLHIDFLMQWLPELSKRRKGIYLETAGDLPDELEQIASWVDYVAMDVKLSSVTGEPNCFAKHAAFLAICKKHPLTRFVKIVVSANTYEQELLEAIDFLKDERVVLQPMSPSKKVNLPPSGKQLLTWQKMLLNAGVKSVRVIPQTHRIMEVL